VGGVRGTGQEAYLSDKDDEADETYLPYHAFNAFDENYDPNKENRNERNNRPPKMKCQNQVYFYQQSKYKTERMNKYKAEDPKNNQGGLLGLVGRSNCGDRNNIDAVADEKEGDCMFELFHMVMNMTGSSKEQFCRYNRKLFDLFEIRKHRPDLATRIPTSANHLKAHITEGSHSMLKNFPVQQVFEIADHACVSLVETYRLMAGHGAEHHFGWDGQERNMEGLNGTKAMDDLIEEVNNSMKAAGVNEQVRVKTKIGWLLFWSDGFLRCFIKQKDNSVWILTVTICPPTEKKSSHLYTHVLAMGRHDADHTPVIVHYMKEVAELMKGIDCYFGSSNSIERVAFGMVAWNADRPELQMLTNTRKEGTYGKVLGWAVNVSEKRLPACKRCYASLIRKMTPEGVRVENNTVPVCNKCANWSLVREEDGIEKVECMNDVASKHYPKQYPERTDIDPQPEGRTCSHKILPPKKLNTPWMLQAVRSGYFGVRLGNWPKKTATEYLRTCNIKTSTGEFVIESALNDKKKGVVRVDLVEPEFWKTVDCFGSFKFPLLPLHGLCHGIIPDVMAINHQIFKKYGKMKTFCDFANPILEDVASFGLSYMKVKLLPKAAWVGEHCLAFCRLMSYLYGTFLLNNTLGSSEEAKITVKFMLCMLNSFQSLMSIFMSKTTSKKEDIDEHIKLFMSAAHYLHSQHGKLDTSEKNADKTGGGSKTKKRFVDLQSKDNLVLMLRELDEIDTGNIGSLRERLNKVTAKTLQDKLTALEPGIKTSSGKEDLFVQLHNIVIPDDANDSADEEGNNETHTKQKKERMCWNKGNWLSYMAEISIQIDHLGNLHLIW
jgi:hypothetical protein